MKYCSLKAELNPALETVVPGLESGVNISFNSDYCLVVGLLF